MLKYLADLHYLEVRHNGLLEITDGCRMTMHEPDEQEVTAEVVGTKLDNAFGESINEEQIAGGSQEMVVIIRRYDAESNHKVFRVNLATLIALARRADMND